MTDNGIETKGIESLCETLKSNSTLTELDISGEWSGNSTKEYKWWIAMRMIGNKGGDEGAKALGEMFLENRSLKTLYYNSLKNMKWKTKGEDSQWKNTETSFDVEGAKSLSKGLETNTSLTKLNLQGKYINKHCFCVWCHFHLNREWDQRQGSDWIEQDADEEHNTSRFESLWLVMGSLSEWIKQKGVTCFLKQTRYLGMKEQKHCWKHLMVIQHWHGLA